jgi:hypothetical protein
MMPVITSPSLVVETPNLEAQGYTFGDGKDCTIRATMAVTGLKYRVVLDAFTKAGRKKGRGCHKGVQSAAWNYLGYKWIETDHKDRAKTLGSLQKYLMKFDDTAPLLVYTKGHLTAFVNTRCIEWLSPRKRIWFSGTGRLEKM